MKNFINSFKRIGFKIWHTSFLNKHGREINESKATKEELTLFKNLMLRGKTRTKVVDGEREHTIGETDE